MAWTSFHAAGGSVQCRGKSSQSVYFFCVLFGQLQPPSVQHEVYKQPCTSLHILSYSGGLELVSFISAA